MVIFGSAITFPQRHRLVGGWIKLYQKPLTNDESQIERAEIARV